MSHSFLIQPGRWHMSGHTIDQAGQATTISGTWHVRWTQDEWFQMIAQLQLEGSTACWDLNYKGFLGPEAQIYNYVSTHTKWGRLEGHGRLTDRAFEVPPGWWARSKSGWCGRVGGVVVVGVDSPLRGSPRCGGILLWTEVGSWCVI